MCGSENSISSAYSITSNVCGQLVKLEDSKSAHFIFPLLFDRKEVVIFIKNNIKLLQLSYTRRLN
jgi:hypothetical protein